MASNGRVGLQEVNIRFGMKRWLFVIGAICVIAASVFLASLPAIKRHVEMVNCGNQMHAVLFAAALLWPDEHNGRLPFDFLSMSNELGDPRILICPGDQSHKPAPNWATFSTNNCSYEIVAPGLLKSNGNTIFMRCNLHGYVGYADDRLLDASGGVVKPNRMW